VAVRLLITALATALLVSIVPAVTSAQTAFGVLNVWLKKQESADAPNDQQITNSPALSIATPNAYFSLFGLPSVAVVQRA
jgi:hypothetical protein